MSNGPYRDNLPVSGEAYQELREENDRLRMRVDVLENADKNHTLIWRCSLCNRKLPAQGSKIFVEDDRPHTMVLRKNGVLRHFRVCGKCLPVMQDWHRFWVEEKRVDENRLAPDTHIDWQSAE